MRRVLVLAFHFPPNVGTGTVRVTKFCKYLPEFGWETVVVTSSFMVQADPKMLAELPAGLQIHSTGDLFLPLQRLGIFTSPAKTAAPASAARGTLALALARFKRIARAVLTQTLMPDPNIVSWAPFAYRAACRILDREKFDAVFSTSPPHSTQLVAYWLKRRYPRIPWIMDLRDLWSQADLFANMRLQYWANCQLERQCLLKADRTLVVTEGIRELTLRKLAGTAASRIVTLTNGYDPADMEALPPVERYSKFTLTYVGALTDQRNQNEFVPALQELAQDAAVCARLQIRLIGFLSPKVQRDLQSLCELGFVAVSPWLARLDALREMQRADVLLLIEANSPELTLNHSNKLFEYMATGKPILGIVPEGEAAKVIRQENAGWVVSPDDRTRIKQAILDQLGRFEHDALAPPSLKRHYPQYHRRTLTHQLAQILDACVEASRPPQG